MLANPAFRRSMPVKLFGSLTMDLFKLIDGAGETVEITDLMERFTLDAIGNVGFGKQELLLDANFWSFTDDTHIHRF